ncbi:hypothetical protein SLEP1_g43734 [Rubroshorea leprosula]|uniref:Uncharacterized protein n=1 Tax=Rubroshorea leprosula TaxID=152421 RepID=A0AAV5LF02_9ROSI|nr:hypothetical protein SLEP1_g43734 [Rubroshorea leprosula]
MPLVSPYPWYNTECAGLQQSNLNILCWCLQIQVRWEAAVVKVHSW